MYKCGTGREHVVRPARDTSFTGGRIGEHDEVQGIYRIADAAVCFSGERDSIEIIERLIRGARTL